MRPITFPLMAGQHGRRLIRNDVAELSFSLIDVLVHEINFYCVESMDDGQQQQRLKLIVFVRRPTVTKQMYLQWITNDPVCSSKFE